MSFFFVIFRVMVCVLVFQLLMVGVFLLKEIWFAAVFLAPLLICTVLFWAFISETYVSHSMFLTSEEGGDVEKAEPRFLMVSCVIVYLRYP